MKYLKCNLILKKYRCKSMNIETFKSTVIHGKNYLNKSYIIENNSFWESLYRISVSVAIDYEMLKNLFNTCQRPAIQEITNYNINPLNKVSDISYADYDDCSLGIILSKIGASIESYEILLSHIDRYELEENKHIHKGTIYYFLGGQYISKKEDVEKGLLYIHKAFIEDDLKHYPSVYQIPYTPSYKFISLDTNNTKQALLAIVRRIVNFIETNFINSYNTKLNKNISYKDIFDKFLNKALATGDHRHLDHVVYFNLLINKLEKIYKMPKNIFNSLAGEILLADFIANICLLIESYGKYKINISDRTATIDKLHKKLIDDGFYATWCNSKINGKDFEEEKLENTLNNLFNNSYSPTNTCITIIDELQSSFFLSWGLRNKVHHNINSIQILKDNFRTIVEKQMMFFIDFALK